MSIIEKSIKTLKEELAKDKDSKVQKDLRYAIHFLTEAIKTKKNLKKEQKKLEAEEELEQEKQLRLMREIAARRRIKD